jgi:hypothetical protein
LTSLDHGCAGVAHAVSILGPRDIDCRAEQFGSRSEPAGAFHDNDGGREALIAVADWRRVQAPDREPQREVLLGLEPVEGSLD